MGGGEGASAFCRILYDSPYPPYIGAISFGFIAVGISSKVTMSPYQIIVADAADAVSVNFSGRCKFLQI